MAQNGITTKFLSEVGTAVGNGGLIAADTSPTVCGMPLKYISLVTLAVQNAALTIIMHYSRVSTSPSKTYSAASAVLLTELLKGSISLAIAYARVDEYSPRTQRQLTTRSAFLQSPKSIIARFRRLGREVFSPDCWKLSIPAILYVIQNNLQFVAASNLEAATFQVTYQMKILTTAAFSVLLLRKQLSSKKWMALLALAIGVGVVQIQAGSGKPSGHSQHEMHAFEGFLAVVAACFTSGLAGVYFEMVLKGSHADLWVRNVQLSLFSLLPALVPVFASTSAPTGGAGWFWTLFAHFGPWAWATVAIQVFGGLITAVVIKYSDNILKGFATSLSIVLSFLASVALFGFHITPSFVVGATTVLAATWLYNQPENREGGTGASVQLPKIVRGVMASSRRSLSRKSSLSDHVESSAPILGEPEKKRLSLGLASALGLALSPVVSPRTSVDLGRPNGNGFAGHNEALAYGVSASGHSTPSYGYPTPRHSPTTSSPPSSFPPSRKSSSAHLASAGTRVALSHAGFANALPPYYGGSGPEHVIRLDERPIP